MARGGFNLKNIVFMALGLDPSPANRGLASFAGSAHNAGRATEKFERSTKNLTASLGVLGGYFGVRQLVEYADTWTLINARVRLVTDTMEESMAIQHRLTQIAKSTRNSLAATSVLYTRVALNADQLGRSHGELLTMVESVNAAMLLSGATGVESAQAMRQLAQALGSGRVQGDEFRTVMEAMPLVARAIADEMGVAMGDLYRLSKRGEIDVQTVIDALIKKNKELTEGVANMPWTIGQAFEYFMTSATEMVGMINMAYNVSGNFAEALKWAGDNLGKMMAAVVAITAAMVTYRIAVLSIVAAQKIMTGLDILKSMLIMAQNIRQMAGAMAMLQYFGKGALATLAAIGVGIVGFAAYKTALAEITAITAEWAQAEFDKNKALGEARDIDYDLIDLQEKQLKIRQDMEREAAQAIVMAGYTGQAQERLQIKFDAVNKRIEARRELTGDLLRLMLDMIDKEEKWLLYANDISTALEEANDAIKEFEKVVDNFADNVQRSMGDVFYDIMREGIDRFSDLFDAIKQLFYRMLADMASAAFMDAFGEQLKSTLRNAFSALTDKQAEALKAAGILRGQAGDYMIPATMGDPRGTLNESPGKATDAAGVELTSVSSEAATQWAQIFAKVLGPTLAGFAVGMMMGSSAHAMGGNAGHGMLGGALGGAATGFMMGGAPGAAVGALAGAVGGLLGWSKAEAEERKKNRAILEANNHRLQELRDAIEGTSLLDRLQGGREAFARMEAIGSGTMSQFMANLGNAAELRRLAEELGIDLGAPGAWEQLQEAVHLSIVNLTQFGNTLDDWTRRIDAYNQLFDVDVTPQQALDDIFKIMSEMAPELIEHLGLTDVDLTTEAGRNEFLAALQEIYMMMLSGAFTDNPALMGAFDSIDELTGFILRAKDALDKFNQQLYDVTTDFPRAMDIIYYEQLHGRYGIGEPVSGGRTRNPVDPSGWTVHGGITIVVQDTDTGEAILNRVEKAARLRRSRGGEVELTTDGRDGW